MNKPYTYVIRYAKTNKIFYGSEDPAATIGVGKSFIKDPILKKIYPASKRTTIQVRQFFNTIKEANDWATKVRRRLNIE